MVTGKPNSGIIYRRSLKINSGVFDHEDFHKLIRVFQEFDSAASSTRSHGSIALTSENEYIAEMQNLDESIFFQILDGEYIKEIRFNIGDFTQNHIIMIIKRTDAFESVPQSYLQISSKNNDLVNSTYMKIEHILKNVSKSPFWFVNSVLISLVVTVLMWIILYLFIAYLLYTIGLINLVDKTSEAKAMGTGMGVMAGIVALWFESKISKRFPRVMILSSTVKNKTRYTYSGLARYLTTNIAIPISITLAVSYFMSHYFG